MTRGVAATAVVTLGLTAAVACSGGASRPEPPPREGAAPTAIPAPIVTTERGPRGGRLVFVDEDGARVDDLMPIATRPAVDTNPAWSPDGRWIVFASSRGRATLAESNLWLVPTGGGPPRRLSRSPEVQRDPRWSPDGRTLFYASNAAGHFDLYRLDLDASGETPRPRGAPVRLTDAPGDELSPAVAPDGGALVYMAVDRSSGRSRLERIPSRGGPPTSLTDGPADLTPTFSPDGQTIVFAAPVKGRGDTDLFAVRLDGSGRRTLAGTADADETGPLLSADGRFLFATAVFRSVTGRPILSSIVVADLAARPTVLRALHDRAAVSPRLGVALAPGGLDRGRLAANRPYRDAIRQVIRELESAAPPGGAPPTR